MIEKDSITVHCEDVILISVLIKLIHIATHILYTHFTLSVTLWWHSAKDAWVNPSSRGPLAAFWRRSLLQRDRRSGASKEARSERDRACLLADLACSQPPKDRMMTISNSHYALAPDMDTPKHLPPSAPSFCRMDERSAKQRTSNSRTHTCRLPLTDWLTDAD